MSRMFKLICLVLSVSLVLAAEGRPGAQAKEGLVELAQEVVFSDFLAWEPLMSDYTRVRLTVTGPHGYIFERTFSVAESPVFEPVEHSGKPLADGFYTYELRFVPTPEALESVGLESGGPTGTEAVSSFVQTGSFQIQAGDLSPVRSRSQTFFPAARVDEPGSLPAAFDDPDNFTIAGYLRDRH